MLKYFIIFLIVLLVLDLILGIKLEARLIKKHHQPLLLKIRLFNKTIFQTTLKKTSHQSSNFKFQLSYLFETDLNTILKDLKEDNFFVYLILEYGTLKKVTVIPTYNSSNPSLLPYLGVADWLIASIIKRYLDETFKTIEDAYYQIVLLKEEQQSLNFEIYVNVTLWAFVKTIIKKFKVFLKLFHKKEQNYE